MDCVCVYVPVDLVSGFSYTLIDQEIDFGFLGLG